MNGKALLNPIEKLEQLGINVDQSSKKAASYRSRKSNALSNGSNAVSKSKAISVRANDKG